MLQRLKHLISAIIARFRPRPKRIKHVTTDQMRAILLELQDSLKEQFEGEAELYKRIAAKRQRNEEVRSKGWKIPEP